MKKEDRVFSIIKPLEEGKLDALLREANEKIKEYSAIEFIFGRNEIKMYNDVIIALLTTEEFPVIDEDTGEETTINGFDYLDSYIEGYEEGMEYFEKKFAPDPGILYGPKARDYVKDLQHNYFKVKHAGIREGWISVKDQMPNFIYHKSIKEVFGYYSGIIGKVDELKSQYPEVFENFDKCILEASEKVHLLSIPTKLTPEEILNFWLKFKGNNEKGEPYWDNKQEIEHFVNQNFDVFPGVTEIKVFNPNMSKSELNHVTWTFYHNYGTSKTKKQYEKLLMLNFTKFKDGSNVYSNIKDQFNKHLNKLIT